MDENQESEIRGDHDNRPWEAEDEDCSRSRALGETNGNGRLCIKLKFPKVEPFPDEQEHGPAPAAIAKEFPRICNICKKGFGSGKALGGHMRMHVQAAKRELLEKNQTPKLNKQIAAADDRSLGPTKTDASVLIMGKPTCYVCGKDFPTMKALFGHMRCHPGRPWRGILPPPSGKNTESSSSSTLSDDKIDYATEAAVLVDLSNSLLGWKVTGKRGRKNIDSTSGSDSDHLTGVEESTRTAVIQLMRLANGSPMKRLIDDSEPSEANINSLAHGRDTSSPKKKLRIDQAEADAGSSREELSRKINDDKGKGKAVPESALPCMEWKLWEDEAWPRDNHYSNSSIGDKDLERLNSNTSELVSDDEILGEMVSKKRKKRKIKFVELEALCDASVQSQKQIPLTPNRYKCCICHKSFQSHQALGGHKSSHNKLKYNQAVDEYVSADDAAAEDCGHYVNPTTQVEEAENILPAGTHQCKICDKTFPTGQALGGHKRCHWTGPGESQFGQVISPGEAKAQTSQVTPPGEAKAQSSQETSPGEAKAQVSQVTSPEEASQTGRRILDIDLNKLPSTEVDEGIVESVFDMCVPENAPAGYDSF